MKDITLGQIGRAIARYQPFIAGVIAAVLIVALLPDRRSGNGTVTAGAPTTR